MCEVCRRSRCDSRCPNAPEEPVFAECEHCGADIHYGDKYYDLAGHKICAKCITSAEEYAEIE